MPRTYKVLSPDVVWLQRSCRIFYFLHKKWMIQNEQKRKNMQFVNKSEKADSIKSFAVTISISSGSEVTPVPHEIHSSWKRGPD